MAFFRRKKEETDQPIEAVVPSGTVTQEDWYTPYAGFTVPESWKLDAEQREELLRDAWALVLQGEDDPQAYVERLDYLIDDVGIDDDEAESYFEDVIERRRAQQRALGGPPSSRLSEAFDELASLGVVARENFTCCGTCGAAEIGDERDDSRQWRGYIFYHQQDAERIPEDHSTYIGYGVFLNAYLDEAEWNALSDDHKESRYQELTIRLMSDEVIPVLRRHGVDVEWDEDLGTRILLKNVDFFAAV